ncbi:hypothetical protein NXF25_003495 [Crotalus adamanteus]|uniref:G-protein coupled receptors family 1 profile domain-containing protein n=1 Tax=Crotalus adamanteus TaxID=8729 RepID=A0AAW1CFT0_CROAD
MNSSNCSNCTRVHDLVFASSYSLIFTIGLLLNSTALYIFIFGDVVRSVTTIYMKNLAVCDLLLLASMPLRIYYYGWQPELSQTTCEVAGLLLLVNMYGSIFLLTCISSDRWMAVRFPLSSWAQAIRRQAKYICVGIWTLSIGGAIPTYLAAKNATNHSSTLCFDENPHYITNAGVSSTMVLCYAITLVVTVTSSFNLLHVFHRSVSVEMELINISKIRLMVVTNVVIFLGCFLPYHLTVLCFLVRGLNETTKQVYRYVLLLSCVNAALDPLAYYFTTETFQQQVPLEPFLRSRASHCDYAEEIMRSGQPLETQSPSAS